MKIRALLFSLAATALFGQPQPQELDSKPKVEFITSLGSFTIQLDTEAAPKTVDNFLWYVKSGYYKDTIFHRVIDNFMVQGGGQNVKGVLKTATRKPIENEARQAQEKGHRNVRGAIAMARTGDPNSATCQFFINVVDNARLDFPNPDGHGYCVFGAVIDGMDTIDKIRSVETLPGDVPKELVVITSAKIIPAKPPAKMPVRKLPTINSPAGKS